MSKNWVHTNILKRKQTRNLICSKQRKGSRKKSLGTFLRYMIECNYDRAYRSRSNQMIRIAFIVVRYVVKKISEFQVV